MAHLPARASLQARPQSVSDALIHFRKSQDLSILRRINKLGTHMASSWRTLARPASFWRTIRGYLAAGRWKRGTPIVDRDGLRRFLETRSSFVTQMSLYGYLRTRAGMRYPELFSNDEFAKAVDAAKWQMWLACLSDLSVYAGGLLARRSGADNASDRAADGRDARGHSRRQRGRQRRRARRARAHAAGAMRLGGGAGRRDARSTRARARSSSAPPSSTNSSSSTRKSCATRCASAGSRCVASCAATSTPRP